MCIYIYILHMDLHGMYILYMYICDASIDPQTRRDMPRRIGRFIRKVLKCFSCSGFKVSTSLETLHIKLTWRLVIKIKGIFLIQKKNEKTPPKSMQTCRNPNQQNHGFRLFCIFFMGKGLELGVKPLTGHEDSITKPSGPDR